MRTLFRILLAGSVLAVPHAALAAGPLPVSLRGVPIPPVPGLLDGPSPIVVDRAAAIVLGKALFWDQNVGSDGQACASCHFSAGADARIKNQINPGQNSTKPSGQVFGVLGSGGGGPNHSLSAADFPLDPDNDDVIGSAGTFGGGFAGVSPHAGADDDCVRAPDPVFSRGAVGVRRVEARNAPSIINAVFNHRNLWDGRANNVFNGSSPWGPRDPDAGVWVKAGGRGVVKQRLALINSSLASQAVEPPIFNDVEMGCKGRGWPDIGRKLLQRQPLQYQEVHPRDSVLGRLSQSARDQLRPGLRTTYRALISQAFDARYWSHGATGPFGAPAGGGAPYNQMEANFAMFFGLAIQLYESTLVSDQSPFDLSPLDANMKPTWTNVSDPQLAASLRNGFDLFINGKCNACHAGPALSLAAVATHAALLTPTPGASFGPPGTPIPYGPDALGPDGAAAAGGVTRFGGPVTRDFVGAQQIPRLMDLGFVNTGVTHPADDPGVAGLDPFGNPLSYSAQYVQYLLGNKAGVVDLPIAKLRSCDFVTPLALDRPAFGSHVFQPVDGVEPDGARDGALRDKECLDPGAAYIPTVAAAQANVGHVKMSTALEGAFKVPGLRNVELTGPYMHNGAIGNLMHLTVFYGSHGNFPSGVMTHASMSSIPAFIGGDPDLVNFLKALTDERVRYRRAPFDHPQLTVPHGQVGSALNPEPGHPLGAFLAKDELLVIPAVGAEGAATPLLPFLQTAP